MLTIDQLKEIFPRMKKNPKTCAALFPKLIEAMKEAEINTPERIAGFLGQVGVESGEFKYATEIWGPSPQQLRYEPPTTLAVKLGNTQKGDGKLFVGRSYIQLTGRANYRACGKDLGLDLENNPELASSPEHIFKVTTWFWTRNKLNAYCDKQDYKELTRRVNGGYNHLDERLKYTQKALSILKA